MKFKSKIDSSSDMYYVLYCTHNYIWKFGKIFHRNKILNIN